MKPEELLHAIGEADERFYAAACPDPESLPDFSTEGWYTEEMVVTKAVAPKRYPQILMTMGAAAACIAMAVGFTRYLQDAPPDMTDDSSVPQIVTTTTTHHTTTQNTTGTSASGTSQSSGTVEPIVQTTTTGTTTEITDSTTTVQTTPVLTTTTTSTTAAPQRLEGVYEGFSYVIENNAAAIVGYDNSAQTVEIPDTIQGYPVTAIGDLAFYNCNMLSVTIPDSVQSLGIGAFSSCSLLESVRLPQGITRLPECLFAGNGHLLSVTIPESVTSIGTMAFMSCNELETLVVPASVSELGEAAFYGSIHPILLNPNCSIATEGEIGVYPLVRSGRISGYEGSTAQQYALRFGVPFISLGEAPVALTTTVSEQTSETVTTTTTTLPFSECTLGDVDMNGEVDIFDASHIIIFFNLNVVMDEEGHLTAEQQQLSDITGDGVIDTVDGVEIMKYCAYLYLTDDPVDFGAFIADPYYSEMLSEQFWEPVAWYRVLLNGQIAIDTINVAVNASRTS